MGKGTVRDTVDSPRTVVIHLWDASADEMIRRSDRAPRIIQSYVPSAGFAVVCPWWLECFTSFAPPLPAAGTFVRNDR